MRFSVPTAVLAFCAAVGVASPFPEPGNAGVDVSKVYIEGITYAGSGCKAGSVAYSKNNDWTIVTLAFDSYVASIGPGVTFTERRKNCNINLKLHYPPGYQYTLYQTDYTGRADLEAKVKAGQQSDYWFAGFAQNKATLKSAWVGVFSDNFNFRDTLIESSWVWSPCGKDANLNINSQVFLDNTDNPKGSGYISTDVIDHSVKTLYNHYGLWWRKC